MRKELIETCTPKSNSAYRNKSLSVIHEFNWTKLATDLKRTAPTLSTILYKCAGAKRSVIRPGSIEIIVAVTAGVLLRNSSQRANIIQRYFLCCYMLVMLQNR